jgi:selenocysteine lyase/cysteine desulfurase
MELARYLQLDEADGVLRIGLAHYNTAAEIEGLIGALRELLR